MILKNVLVSPLLLETVSFYRSHPILLLSLLRNNIFFMFISTLWCLYWRNFLTSSILVAEVGEPPDVAQPDDLSGHRQDKLDLIVPLPPLIVPHVF